MSDLQQRTGDNSNECNFQSQICRNKPPFVVCGDYDDEEEEEEYADDLDLELLAMEVERSNIDDLVDVVHVLCAV